VIATRKFGGICESSCSSSAGVCSVWTLLIVMVNCSIPSVCQQIGNSFSAAGCMVMNSDLGELHENLK
jgi:hypothetical protein